MDKLKGFLKAQNIEFHENFDGSIISSIKLGAIIKIAIFPKNERELEKILVFASLIKCPVRVFGNASNILIVNNIEFPVVFTTKMNDDILIDRGIVSVSAGVLLSRFFDVLKKNNLSGFEGLIGIPATVGGAIMNNAGAYGYHISDRLLSVKVFKNGKIFAHQRNMLFSFISKAYASYSG